MINFKDSSFFSVREIAYLSIIVAVSAVSRMLFQVLPNIQPMTAFFLIVTLQLGILRGLLVSILSVVITNLYLGMGVWTIAQIASYAVIIVIVGILCRFSWYRKSFFWQIVMSSGTGFLYGFVISIISVKMYGFPSFWAYYFQGLSFDILHAVGNGIFYFLLTPFFVKLLKVLVKETTIKDEWHD